MIEAAALIVAFSFAVWVGAWIINANIVHDSRLRGRYSVRRY